MKIIYWTELFLPDISGVSILGQNVLPEMQKRGFEFIIITSHGRHNVPDLDEFNGIPIYRFNFHTALINKDFGKINKIVDKLNHIRQEFKPDLVHLNSSEPSLFYFDHSKLKHIPKIVTIHLFINEIHNTNALFQRILKDANWVTTVSSETLTQIQKMLPQLNYRSTCIKNAIKTPLIEPQSIHQFQNKLLFIGRLAKGKGVEVALKAFSIINREIDKTKLIIAGNGPEMNNLKDSSIKYGLTNSVSFIGEVSPLEIPKLINSTFSVIVPSIEEEQGSIVSLQAGIMERPVVASNVRGLREIIKDNITGLIVRKNDHNDLANKILFLLRNPKIAEKLGKSARKRVSSDYNFDKCLNEYEKIYRGALNNINSDE
jgi:glycosyltransferase involved in cell wall biosynthesis